MERDRRGVRARSRRPRRQGGRHRQHLERHHPGLAGRWRRPVAGGADGTADLRSHRKACGLSGFRGLPRSRRTDPARRVAPPRIFQRSASAAAAFGRYLPGRMPAGDSPAAELPDIPVVASSGHAELPASIAVETSHQTDLETPVETPNETLKNVLPFRPISEPKSPALTPVENSAFNELARQLSARLEGETGAAATPDLSDAADEHCRTAAAPEPRPNRRPKRRSGWRSPSRRRAARPGATGCCSTSCRSAS